MIRRFVRLLVQLHGPALWQWPLYFQLY